MPSYSYCETCNPILKRFASCPNEVRYPSGGDSWDAFVEFIWVFASVLPYFVNIGFAICLIFARSSRLLWMFGAIGFQSLVNEHFLKRILAENRPYGACSSSYGLPSGHSSFTSALATWLILEWVVLHDKVPFKKSPFYKAITISYLLFSPLIPISRHYLNYHTIKQIFCGLATGVLFSAVSFYLMVVILHKNEGTYWSSFMRKFNLKLRIEEDILLYKSENGEMLLHEIQDGTLPDQENGDGLSVKKIYIILPLKESIRDMLWKSNKKTPFDGRKSLDLQTL